MIRAKEYERQRYIIIVALDIKNASRREDMSLPFSHQLVNKESLY